MIDIDVAARETLDKAIAGLRESGYLEWLESTYKKAADAAAKDQGRGPRAWTEEDERRMLFEAVGYMCALMLERELDEYLTQRTLFGQKPDRKRIEAFRTSLLRYVPEKMGVMGMGKVPVSAAGPVAAHDVSAVERIQEYSRGRNGKRAFEHFGACMGRALDPSLETVSSIVALESIPMLVLVIRGALDREFGVPPRRRVGRKIVSIALAVAATVAVALAGDFDCFVAPSLGATVPAEAPTYP
jgi:hypothetical protein